MDLISNELVELMNEIELCSRFIAITEPFLDIKTLEFVQDIRAKLVVIMQKYIATNESKILVLVDENTGVDDKKKELDEITEGNEDEDLKDAAGQVSKDAVAKIEKVAEKVAEVKPDVKEELVPKVATAVVEEKK